jgi:hypothetical protein
MAMNAHLRVDMYIRKKVKIMIKEVKVLEGYSLNGCKCTFNGKKKVNVSFTSMYKGNEVLRIGRFSTRSRREHE